MKRITVIVNLLFLFGTTGLAQNKIDKVAYDHWVDYANCRYTAAYIETLRNDPKEQVSIKNYDDQIRKKIEQCTYENSMPFKDLSELLKKNGWTVTEKNISEKINEKKQQFQGNEMDVAEVIDLLKLDGNLATKLQTSVDGLVKEVKEKYKPVTPVPGSESGQTPTPEAATSSNEHSHSLLWLVLSANWLVLTLWLFMFRKKGEKPKESDREKIITTVLESQRIEARFVLREHYKAPEGISDLNDKIESLKTEIKGLQDKISNNEKKNITGEKVSGANTETDSSKYYKFKNGKVLIEEVSGIEGASFKVFNINGNEAEFAYCGGVVNQDFFTDVCSFGNNPSDVPNKTKIITTAPGAVKKDSNNRWEVTEKAVIKFM